MINRFSEEYSFLSNMYPCEIEYEGIVYPSVEHAYVAAKTGSLTWRLEVLKCDTPKKAKKLGKKLPLRDDWEDVKLEVMIILVLQKFSKHDELKKMLLATGNRELIEGNWWNDRYWGVCNGIGQNYLGKILMEVRDLLRKSDHIN